MRQESPRITIREIPYDSAEYGRMLVFRNTHMRVPLGLSLFDEDLSREKNDYHIAVYREEPVQLIGVCIITPLNETAARMRQVVIAPEYRNHGIGRSMMQFAEKKAASLGIRRLILDSRLSAIRFYEKLGFKKVGTQFMEVGLPHYMMERKIK